MTTTPSAARREAEATSTGRRRPRFFPVRHMLVLALVFGAFAALVTLMVTRNWASTGIMFAIAAVVSLVVVALISLTVRPADFEPVDGPVLTPRDPK